MQVLETKQKTALDEWFGICGRSERIGSRGTLYVPDAPHSLALKLRKACFRLLIVEPDIVSQCDVLNLETRAGFNKKRPYETVFFIKSGRGERIRTFDTLVPNQVLYQTELRPESEINYKPNFIKIKYILLFIC